MNKEKLASPPMIFVMYVTTACLVVLLFRLIYPGEPSPLPIYSKDWRLLRGLLDIIALFPALALSALVIPFGLGSEDNEYSGFSEHFFQRLMSPLITAICAACLCAGLTFLALPMAQGYEENLRFQSDVYHWSKERAQNHRAAGEWLEADEFIGICDSVWDRSPELEALRTEVEINLEKIRFEDKWPKEPAKPQNSASISALPGQGEPLNASDAIAQGEAALADGRLYDAHWLATVGRRIAKAGSPESTKAAQLASRAWNRIESQKPNARETEVYSIYQLKLSGYEAMVSGDWIRAYYIFKGLMEMTPFDPDAKKFFTASEKGTKEVAFFIDEIDMNEGEMLAGAIFSMPYTHGKDQRRYVVRVNSLSAGPDLAYGQGMEYMVFDSNSRLLLSLQSSYAKFLPITINDKPQVLVMMRALDRNDRTKRYEPTWSPQHNTLYSAETAQVTLDIDYGTFLMLSEIRQGLPTMYTNVLFNAAKVAGSAGYIPQVFEAEILNRLGGCLFFLPMAVFIIVIGWRLRAKIRPRYFFVISLPILPIVFNGVVHLYQSLINTVGISLLFAFDFSFALTAFIVFLSVTFVLSLIILAAQHD